MVLPSHQIRIKYGQAWPEHVLGTLFFFDEVWVFGDEDWKVVWKTFYKTAQWFFTIIKENRNNILISISL